MKDFEKQEENAIDLAYGLHVQGLVRTLISNLVTGEDEKVSIQHFMAGVKIARYAVQLAQEALAGESE